MLQKPKNDQYEHIEQDVSPSQAKPQGEATSAKQASGTHNLKTPPSACLPVAHPPLHAARKDCNQDLSQEQAAGPG